MKPQFGLIIPKAKKELTEKVRNESVLAPPVKVASIFTEDDEGDLEDEEAELTRLRQLKNPASVSLVSSNTFTRSIQDQALQEDPDIFDYDKDFDERQGSTMNLRTQNSHRNSRFSAAQKSAPGSSQHKDSNDRGPKYMENILMKAEERRTESELVRLRNMKRKSGAMDPEGEEVFITEAYQERLRELEAKEAELRARQAREEGGDVRKKNDMNGFYYNLMKRNVSFGGQKKSKPLEEKDKNEESLPSDTAVAAEQPSTTTASKADGDEVVSFGPQRPPSRK